jgi:hypothetical protein
VFVLAFNALALPTWSGVRFSTLVLRLSPGEVHGTAVNAR